MAGSSLFSVADPGRGSFPGTGVSDPGYIPSSETTRNRISRKEIKPSNGKCLDLRGGKTQAKGVAGNRINHRSTSAPLTVVTANVRNSGADDGIHAWPLRKDALLAHLRALSPDILGVQEALADQHDALVAAFPAHHAIGVGRDDAQRQGEFASLLLRKSAFELAGSGHFWLSPAFDVIGSIGWDAQITRICTWAFVRHKATGGALLVANTHFDHIGVKAREESALLLSARLHTLARTGAVSPSVAGASAPAPILLLGDFNCEETTPAYRTFLAAGFFDTYRMLHPRPEANELTDHGFRGAIEGRRIDFIFHTRGLRAIAARIDRTQIAPARYLSDHYFVTAVLQYDSTLPPEHGGGAVGAV